jgi:uncharacterized protein involved in exopolysaccharide biosynthesis
MEPVPILVVLRRHFLMIILLCVVATLAGYAFSFLLETRYSASALLLVRPQQPIKMGSEKDDKEFLSFPMGGASAVETASRTYIELIKSRALIADVVEELGLDKPAPQEAKSGWLARLLPPGLKENIGPSLQALTSVLIYGKVIEDDPFNRAVKAVAGDLSLEALQDTYTFELSYMGKDPVRAAEIANTTAKTLIKFVNKLRLAEGRDQSARLEPQLDQSRQQVSLVRSRLEKYKQDHSVFRYDAEYDSKLKVIAELEVELAKLDATLSASQNTLANPSLSARRARLVRSVAERKAELAPMPQIERDLKQLEQELKDAMTTYETLQKQFQQAVLNQSYEIPEVRLVSAAAVPRIPSSPKRLIITAVSLIGGLVAGTSLAFLLEYLNRRIRGIKDIEDFVGIKVIGTVPRVSWWRHGRQAGLL